MFTGLVSDIGTVVAVSGGDSLRKIRIASRYQASTIAIGASIACAGVCLTVTHLGETSEGAWFEVDAAAETLRLTAVGGWKAGTRVNLERALRMGDELGGHIVTGHVDGLSTILKRDEVTPEEANWGATARFLLQAPRPLHRFIAQKGSVTLDGVSLTVNSVEDDEFSVLLIPHTLAVTTFDTRKSGDHVHLEIDMMARYAARLAQSA